SGFHRHTAEAVAGGTAERHECVGDRVIVDHCWNFTAIRKPQGKRSGLNESTLTRWWMHTSCRRGEMKPMKCGSQRTSPERHHDQRMRRSMAEVAIGIQVEVRSTHCS